MYATKKLNIKTAQKWIKSGRGRYNGNVIDDSNLTLCFTDIDCSFDIG